MRNSEKDKEVKKKDIGALADAGAFPQEGSGGDVSREEGMHSSLRKKTSRDCRVGNDFNHA